MRRVYISTLFFVTFMLVGVTSGLAENKIALVVGNASYQHTPELINPRNDAEAISNVLERLGFEVLGGIDLDRQKFEQSVRLFSRKLRTAHVGLFFYAGHGIQVNGRNYLVPIDAELKDESDLDFAMVELNKVLHQMQRNTKTNLVFIDACRDNPLSRNLARAMGLSRSTAIGRGMARTSAGVGTMITYATQPDHVALDGKGKNSPFTKALLNHIETPGLDIAHMLRRVRRQVMKATNGGQVPWNHSSLTAGFEFKSGKNQTKSPRRQKQSPARQRKTPDLPLDDTIVIAFRETRAQGTCGAYTVFEQVYRKSFFARLARDWISENCDKNRGPATGKVKGQARQTNRYPFDGEWQVTIDSRSGCKDNRPVNYFVTVRQGKISEPQHRLPKEGSISTNGKFSINVLSGGGRLLNKQTGKISGNIGTGRFRGRLQSCIGVVTLRR